MRWTRSELDSWRGLEALDADAQPAGEIVATFVDEDSGTPRWLAVRTGTHGDEVTPVPIDDAEPTGGAVRLGHPIERIAAAPHVALGGSLTREQDHELSLFYGLQPPPPAAPRPAGGGAGVDEAVVSALRDAHALERAAHGRLQSLLSALDDVELQHDVARHLTETEGHAAAVAGRLEQLEAAPSSLRDALGIAEAKVSPSPGATEGLLREALEFERRECSAYSELIATARSAGDDRTAQIAEKIRADEEAMAETIAASLRRLG
jgi:ferritin-like metal-binding protein YciE